MIPKIIHQIWIGDKFKKPINLMNTWKEAHEDWEYILWDDEKINNFGLKNQIQYQMSPTFAGKADIARYEILYKMGGFFIDADSVCLKKIPDNFLQYDLVSTYESEKYRPNLCANGYIGIRRKNKIIYDLINYIQTINEEYLKSEHPWKTTGPLPFTSIINQNPNQNIKLLESSILLPEHFESPTFKFIDMKQYDDSMLQILKENYPNSISYQFWGSTKGKY